MTFIMTNSYGYSLKGLRSFAINRFLRLYPSYWFILCLSFLGVVIWGEATSTSYREFMYLPNSLESYLQNMSLLYIDFFPGNVSPRLSPPTWALTIELLFYCLIALGISRSKVGTTVWFFASLAYMISTHIYNLGYSYRYSFVFAGTLPFSIGAMIFHYYRLSWSVYLKHASAIIVPLLLVLFIVNSVTAIFYGEAKTKWYSESVSFYANYVINAVIVVMLIEGKLPFISRNFDTIIGNYSYPIYLMHWIVGFIMSMVIFGAPLRGFHIEGAVVFLAAILVCTAISYLIIRFIDSPVERYRKKIKFRANQQFRAAAKTSSPTSVN